jgi:hypothetical protein
VRAEIGAILCGTEKDKAASAGCEAKEPPATQ